MTTSTCDLQTAVELIGNSWTSVRRNTGQSGPVLRTFAFPSPRLRLLTVGNDIEDAALTARESNFELAERTIPVHAAADRPGARRPVVAADPRSGRLAALRASASQLGQTEGGPALD